MQQEIKRTKYPLNAPDSFYVDSISDQWLNDLVDVETTSPVDTMISEERQASLIRAIVTLPTEQSEIIQLRFGVNLNQSFTRQQTADALHIEVSRVRYLEQKAIQTLQHVSGLQD